MQRQGEANQQLTADYQATRRHTSPDTRFCTARVHAQASAHQQKRMRRMCVLRHKWRCACRSLRTAFGQAEPGSPRYTHTCSVQCMVCTTPCLSAQAQAEPVTATYCWSETVASSTHPGSEQGQAGPPSNTWGGGWCAQTPPSALQGRSVLLQPRKAMALFHQLCPLPRRDAAASLLGAAPDDAGASWAEPCTPVRVECHTTWC